MSDVEEFEDFCPVKCGCGGERIECWQCGGEGEFDCYDDDPINYAPGEEFEACEICRGSGGYWMCTDSARLIRERKQE